MQEATSHVDSPLDIPYLLEKKKQGIVALTTQKVVTTSNTSFKRDLKVFDNTFTYEISLYKDQLYILHFFGRLEI